MYRNIFRSIADKLGYVRDISTFYFIGFVIIVLIISICFYKYKKGTYSSDEDNVEKVKKHVLKTGALSSLLVYICSKFCAILYDLAGGFPPGRIIKYENGIKKFRIYRDVWANESDVFSGQAGVYGGFDKLCYGVIPYIGYSIAAFLLINGVLLFFDYIKKKSNIESSNVNRQKKDSIRWLVIGIILVPLTWIFDIITTVSIT